MVEKTPYEDQSLDIEIEKIKQSLGINKPNSEMEENEIKLVIRTFGERGPDNIHDGNGELIFGPKSISDMLCITLYYFPKHYEKFQFSQPQ